MEARQAAANIDSDFLKQYSDPLERARIAALLIDPVANAAYLTAQVTTKNQ